MYLLCIGMNKDLFTFFDITTVHYVSCTLLPFIIFYKYHYQYLILLLLSF